VLDHVIHRQQFGRLDVARSRHSRGVIAIAVVVAVVVVVVVVVVVFVVEKQFSIG
jgi:cell division protein FtsN